MAEKTGIGWCDHTLNPWWGCTHVSPGCKNCYAETLAKRYGSNVWGKSGDRRFFGDKHWAEPLVWNAKAEREGVRRRVFCGSMMDVFEDRNDLASPRDRLWDLVEATPMLDWLLLTKRPENVRAWSVPWGSYSWPLNVWLGVSVEDQQRADERIPKLMEIPAAVRFLSCEPLIGPLDLYRWLDPWNRALAHSLAYPRHILGPVEDEDGIWRGHMDCVDDGLSEDPYKGFGCGFSTTSNKIDWVIVGGESGPGHRRMDPAWAQSIFDQCKAAGVAFFGKQGSGPRNEMQYGLPDVCWNTKEWPEAPAANSPLPGSLL